MSNCSAGRVARAGRHFTLVFVCMGRVHGSFWYGGGSAEHMEACHALGQWYMRLSVSTADRLHMWRACAFPPATRRRCLSRPLQRAGRSMRWPSPVVRFTHVAPVFASVRRIALKCCWVCVFWTSLFDRRGSRGRSADATQCTMESELRSWSAVGPEHRCQCHQGNYTSSVLAKLPGVC